MFGQMMPPWMQGMGQQGGPQMTPGAGMPPLPGTGNAPMSMQRPQMGPPGATPPVPPMAQPQQQPMNPAQMGMLSQMLMRRTPAPQPQGAAAQAGLPGAGAMPGGIDPSQIGLLRQLAPGMFDPSFNWG